MKHKYTYETNTELCVGCGSTTDIGQDCCNNCLYDIDKLYEFKEAFKTRHETKKTKGDDDGTIFT
jgi:hypothetical protein